MFNLFLFINNFLKVYSTISFDSTATIKEYTYEFF